MKQGRLGLQEKRTDVLQFTTEKHIHSRVLIIKYMLAILQYVSFPQSFSITYVALAEYLLSPHIQHVQNECNITSSVPNLSLFSVKSPINITNSQSEISSPLGLSDFSEHKSDLVTLFYKTFSGLPLPWDRIQTLRCDIQGSL